MAEGEDAPVVQTDDPANISTDPGEDGSTVTYGDQAPVE